MDPNFQSMEYAQQQDMNMEDVTEETPEGTEPIRKKRVWEKIGPDGRPIKRKPNPARKNMMLRKVLIPKNSVMCLNELKPGLKFVAEKVAQVGNFSVSVEVDGQTFWGYGSSKDQAKQACAEAALISFVKPPPPKPATGATPKPEDDGTPWKTLASFAMYKLLTDWRDNKIQGSSGLLNQTSLQSLGMMPGFPGGPAAVQGVPSLPKDECLQSLANISAHLNRTHTVPTVDPAAGNFPAEGTPGPAIDQKYSLKPAMATTFLDKQLKFPTNQMSEKKMDRTVQASRHPVMVLHQMCPHVQYSTSEKVDASGTKIFEVSTELNGQTFVGEGTAVKRAKLALAKLALKALYGIESTYTTGS